MNGLKDFHHEIKNTSELLLGSGFDIRSFQILIEKADGALIACDIASTRYLMLLGELDKSLLNLRKSIRSILNRLKASEKWSGQYALLLDIHYLSGLKHIANCKPVVQLTQSVNFVCINFAKIGVNGMNVYSRLQGETDFLFLGYAKRTKYKDPRPINPPICFRNPRISFKCSCGRQRNWPGQRCHLH
jgi:hypothetical protein